MSKAVGKISAALGETVAASRTLTNSFAGPVLGVETGRGRRYAAKLSDGRVDLSVEGWMLDYLAEHSPLPVPGVIHAAPDLLILSWIEHGGGGLNAAGTEELARHVAALHRCTGTRFGLERDTLIGPLPQPNPQADDWAGFFRDARLLHMAREAHRSGRLPDPLLRTIEGLAERVPEMIGAASSPRLIHGDLWTGNLLTRDGGVAGFVDPACYYADPEIELAFGTLFGPFDRAFFDAYQRLNPLRSGFFERRRDLYLLYPLLVHVRLFGGGYVGQVSAIVDRLAS
ncbi:MAG: fructosamine kinase family protein [Alphaproteobacteria bacterium]|nr:fructosamine kinase family protein [Alphaproteobacteria bacterium]